MIEVGPITRAENAEKKVTELEQINYWLAIYAKWQDPNREEMEKRLEGQRFEIEALDHLRQRDNEHLLGKCGELQSEIDQLASSEKLAIEMGTHLKCLVTALCPIIRHTMIEKGNTEWEDMVGIWEEARGRLGLNAAGGREAA